jgi:aspartyl-tRNA(Asn)/glutamyl-tRNA(Gln) amidotransferase subunit C
MKKIRGIISEEEVKHLAELARIELSNREIASLRIQVNEILDYFRKIDEVDTHNVQPTYHVQDIVNVFREDKPEKPEPDELLKNVPRKKDRYIKAPRIH